MRVATSDCARAASNPIRDDPCRDEEQKRTFTRRHASPRASRFELVARFKLLYTGDFYARGWFASTFIIHFFRRY